MKPRLHTPGKKKALRLKSRGVYFLEPSKDVEYIHSGCTLLDCVLGGGWALSRIANIVGDKSTGKTLLTIEACINFRRAFPTGKIRYVEPEAAFDQSYATELGMPEDVDFAEDMDTVEEVYDDMVETFDALGKKEPCLYVIDSLDSLSDKAEMGRKFDENSYGGTKPKQLGKLFRQLVRKIRSKRVLVIIVSQVRDNIGVMFGEKHTRSGGKALDFYASQIVWLAQTGQTRRVIKKQTQVVGVTVRAKCKKNKVGLPFRECEFNIKFGYGVDDLTANLNFLRDSQRLPLLEVGMTEDSVKRYLSRLDSLTKEGLQEQRLKINQAVKTAWREIQQEFLPRRKKYE